MRRHRGSRATTRWILLVVLVLTLGTAPAADAQLPLPITIAGEMLWIAADRMLVSTRGGPVTVDLSAIPLGDYLAVQPGAAVLVRGVWTEGSVLVASEMRALPGIAGPAAREGL